MRPALGSEHGIVGKILVVTLLLILLVGLTVIEAGSIVYTKFQIDGAAEAAANQAVAEFQRSQSLEEARRVALQTVRDRDAGATVTRFVLVKVTGVVTVSVAKEAATLVVRRVDFLEELGLVRSTATARPAEP